MFFILLSLYFIDWLLASTAEVMNDFDRALILYQNALNHSPYSIQALSSVGTIHHHRENYSKVITFFVLHLLC